jgi:hypothetical protein
MGDIAVCLPDPDEIAAIKAKLERVDNRYKIRWEMLKHDRKDARIFTTKRLQQDRGERLHEINPQLYLRGF